MLDARHSQTRRKSDLKIREKFNQVFDDFLQDENFKIREHQRTNMLQEIQSKLTPTFKYPQKRNSEGSSDNKNFKDQTKENSFHQTGLFVNELSRQQQNGSNSQHQITYIDKLNDSDEVIMPFSQENIESMKEIEQFNDYRESEGQIGVGSEKNIKAQEKQVIYHANEQIDRTLNFKEEKVLEKEELMLIVEKQTNEEVIKESQQNHQELQEENIQIDLPSDDENADQQSGMNDSFEGLRMVQHQLNELSEQKDNSQRQLGKVDGELMTSEEFFEDIRQVHLGVGKSCSSSFIESKETIQLSPQPIKDIQPLNQQSVFQSFDEGSTQYFDCNMFLNNSLSLNNSQHMMNRSRHNLREHNSNNVSPSNHYTCSQQDNQQSLSCLERVLVQDYQVILEDIDEQEIEENFRQELSPGKQSKIKNQLKSHQYIKFSQKDFQNLQKHQQDSISQNKQHRHDLLIMNKITGIFTGLITQYKESYSEFIYSIQQELFNFKQTLVQQKELIAIKFGSQLEKMRHKLMIEIRNQSETDYQHKLRDAIASVEQDFLQREDQWREEMAKKLEEQIGHYYEEKYQRMMSDGNQLKMSYDQEEHKHIYGANQREQYQGIQNYFNKQITSQSNILPSEISMFATTNQLNEPYQPSYLLPHSNHIFSKNKPDPLPILPSNEHQLQSLLDDLSLQNQSLCQQLLLQQQHTLILNEQQLKYKEQIRMMNDMEDQLEEVKRENFQLKAYLFQLEEEKDQMRKLFENQKEKGKEQMNKQIDWLENQIRIKYQQKIEKIKSQCQHIIDQITFGLNQNHTREVNIQTFKFEMNQNQHSQLPLKSHLSQLTQLQHPQLNNQIISLQERLAKQFEQKLSQQLNRKNQYIFTLEDQIKLILEASKEIKDKNLWLEDMNGKLTEEVKGLAEQVNQEKIKKEQIEKELVNLREEKDECININQTLSQQIQILRNQLEQVSDLKEENSKLQKENVILQSQLAQLNLQLIHAKSKTIQPQIPPSIPSSQQPSIIQSLNRSNMRLSQTSNKNPLINQSSLNHHHCITSSSNTLVNQILENIKTRRSRMNYNNSTNFSHNVSGFLASLEARSGRQSNVDITNRGGANLVRMESADSYQLNLKSNPSQRKTQPFSSQQQISHSTKQSPLLSNLLSLQNLAKPFSKQDTTHLKITTRHITNQQLQYSLPVHSPKSPSSTSIMSKKVSSSQKDKKMSMISMKLEKLRSDIKEEIKEISTISK